MDDTGGEYTFSKEKLNQRDNATATHCTFRTTHQSFSVAQHLIHIAPKAVDRSSSLRSGKNGISDQSSGSCQLLIR